MPDTSSFSLSISGVSKSYGRHVICKNVTLELGAGENLAVVGANGAGKSTFLRMLAGLTRPDKGIVAYRRDGTIIDAKQWHRHVGLVSPELALYEELTGLENLTFSAQALGLSVPKGSMDSMLDEFGLLGRGDDAVGTYSSGMKQRLKFAAAFLKTPSLLLLDEPSVTLDEDGIARVWSAIERRQMIVVIATNITQEAGRARQSIRMGGDDA